MLCLQKDKDGKIGTVYYNTGDGVEQNITQGIQLKAITSLQAGISGKFPIKVTFDPTTEEAAGTMLSTVLYNRLIDGTIEDINKNLTSALGPGKSGDPKEIQINGVCSFQVLSEALQDALTPEKGYLKFQHDFLTHIQSSYEKNLQNKSLTHEHAILNQKLLADNRQEIERIEQLLAA